jgi:hypothetical protein
VALRRSAGMVFLTYLLNNRFVKYNASKRASSRRFEAHE